MRKSELKEIIKSAIVSEYDSPQPEVNEDIDEGVMDKLKAAYNNKELLSKIVTVDGKEVSLKDLLGLAASGATAGMAKSGSGKTSSIGEAEEVDVEDNEDIDVDIEKDVKIDDESAESDISVDTEIPGESEDTAAVLGLLTKALDQAQEMGDEKLTDQIGNTITYFTRAHISNVSEVDLDMELDPTDVTKINPEAAAVIGLDEEAEIGLDEKKQGYNDELDDSEGAKHGKKKQSMAQRRADSENMEKADGKRKYSGDKSKDLNESLSFPLWNRIK